MLSDWYSDDSMSTVYGLGFSKNDILRKTTQILFPPTCFHIQTVTL